MEQILRQHRPFVEAVARQYAPHPQDVPDIVQTVHMNVCRAFGSFRGDAKETTWLFRITVNAARAAYRTSQRHERARSLGASEPEPVVDPDERVLGSERISRLQEAVSRLPVRQRQAIERHLSDPDQPDSRPAEKAARHRARVALRRMLLGDPSFS